MDDTANKLLDEMTKTLELISITDAGDDVDTSPDNLSYLVQKYIYGLRQLELDSAIVDQKTLNTNLDRLSNFFGLYDKLQTTAIQRESTKETMQSHKLSSLGKIREIKASVISTSKKTDEDEELITEFDEERISNSEDELPSYVAKRIEEYEED